MNTGSAPVADSTNAGAPMLRVDNVEVRLRGREASLLGPLSFELHAGECLGLIGESGSGKSLTALSLLDLLPPGLQARGTLRIDGGAPIAIGSATQRALRGRGIAWMPQDPLASLHPLRRVGAQLTESLRALRGMAATDAARESRDLFVQLELPDPDALLQRYPHQLSGGQRQRVLLAIALAGNPRLLVADEPTSALDPRLAEELLALLQGLRRARGLALLLISHDLPLVARHADRLAILQGGHLVETNATATLLAAPRHDATRDLLAAEHLPAPQAQRPGEELLRTDGLTLHYPGALQAAVDNADLHLCAGECLALLGESGSGKSSLGRALLRLFRGRTAGHITLAGEDLMASRGPALRRLRGRVGLVFQDPYASLDPRMRVADIVAEPLRIHGLGDPAGRRARALRGLAEVGLDADAMDRYPHQFSGGQRQRIAIARALACDPALLVCDEAVSALDARHRAEVLALLAGLKRERGLAVLFITHDLAAARALADRIAVMAAGRIVEQGPAAALLGGALTLPARRLLGLSGAGDAVAIT